MKFSVNNISPQEFMELSNPPRLIDVRSEWEYNQFHAPHAINLSLLRLWLGSHSWLRRYVVPQWFQTLPRDEPIALICLTAHRSPIAAEQLMKAGFTKVHNITGGMKEWQKLGLPICKNK